MTDNTKNCPFCGKEIELTATKCRYCGKLLEESDVVEAVIVDKINFDNKPQNRCPKCGGEMEYENPIFSRIFKVFIYIVCGFLSFCFIIDILCDSPNPNTTSNLSANKEKTIQKEQPKHKKETQKLQKQKNHELKQSSKQEKFTLIESRFCYGDSYHSAVCGTIKNNTDKKLFLVSVEVELFDRNGSIIARTSDTISRLDPYQSWAFKAYYDESGVASYRISEIDSF